VYKKNSSRKRLCKDEKYANFVLNSRKVKEWKVKKINQATAINFLWD